MSQAPLVEKIEKWKENQRAFLESLSSKHNHDFDSLFDAYQYSFQELYGQLDEISFILNNVGQKMNKKEGFHEVVFGEHKIPTFIGNLFSLDHIRASSLSALLLESACLFINYSPNKREEINEVNSAIITQGSEWGKKMVSGLYVLSNLQSVSLRIAGMLSYDANYQIEAADSMLMSVGCVMSSCEYSRELQIEIVNKLQMYIRKHKNQTMSMFKTLQLMTSVLVLLSDNTLLADHLQWILELEKETLNRTSTFSLPVIFLNEAINGVLNTSIWNILIEKHIKPKQDEEGIYNSQISFGKDEENISEIGDKLELKSYFWKITLASRFPDIWENQVDLLINSITSQPFLIPQYHLKTIFPWIDRNDVSSKDNNAFALYCKFPHLDAALYWMFTHWAIDCGGALAAYYCNILIKLFVKHHKNSLDPEKSFLCMMEYNLTARLLLQTPTTLTLCELEENLKTLSMNGLGDREWTYLMSNSKWIDYSFTVLYFNESDNLKTTSMNFLSWFYGKECKQKQHKFFAVLKSFINNFEDHLIIKWLDKNRTFLRQELSFTCKFIIFYALHGTQSISLVKQLLFYCQELFTNLVQLDNQYTELSCFVSIIFVFIDSINNNEVQEANNILFSAITEWLRETEAIPSAWRIDLEKFLLYKKRCLNQTELF